MSGIRRSWTDDEVDARLGRLLQVGVALAAALVALGGVLYLARHGRSPSELGTFHGEPEDLRHVGGILRAAAAGSGQGLIQLGLLVLVGTPVARVAFSLFAFWRQRDGIYVGITGLVLALLLLSIAGVLL